MVYFQGKLFSGGAEHRPHLVEFRSAGDELPQFFSFVQVAEDDVGDVDAESVFAARGRVVRGTGARGPHVLPHRFVHAVDTRVEGTVEVVVELGDPLDLVPARAFVDEFADAPQEVVDLVHRLFDAVAPLDVVVAGIGRVLLGQATLEGVEQRHDSVGVPRFRRDVPFDVVRRYGVPGRFCDDAPPVPMSGDDSSAAPRRRPARSPGGRRVSVRRVRGGCSRCS